MRSYGTKQSADANPKALSPSATSPQRCENPEKIAENTICRMIDLRLKKLLDHRNAAHKICHDRHIR